MEKCPPLLLYRYFRLGDVFTSRTSGSKKSFEALPGHPSRLYPGLLFSEFAASCSVRKRSAGAMIAIGDKVLLGLPMDHWYTREKETPLGQTLTSPNLETGPLTQPPRIPLKVITENDDRQGRITSYTPDEYEKAVGGSRAKNSQGTWS